MKTNPIQITNLILIFVLITGLGLSTLNKTDQLNKMSTLYNEKINELNDSHKNAIYQERIIKEQSEIITKLRNENEELKKNIPWLEKTE